MVKVQLKGHNIILRPCFVAREITQPGRLFEGSADPGQASKPAKVPLILLYRRT